MGTITFKELDTPESFVTKYLAVKVGLNIRRGKAKYNEVTKEWTVPLRAVVPSRVKLNDSEYKTFVYKFEDVGHAIVTKVDGRYHVGARKPTGFSRGMNRHLLYLLVTSEKDNTKKSRGLANCQNQN